jgi:exopolysaccharide production protein ExoZ
LNSPEAALDRVLAPQRIRAKFRDVEGGTLKLQSIQVLRAVAAIGVVIFHFTTFGVGRAGVDLFFCISGYVMAGQMGRAPAQFAVDRFTRIYPPFLAAMTLLFVVRTVAVDRWRLIHSLALDPNYHAIYLYPAWSLGYEAMFYGGCIAAILFGPRAVLAIFAAAFLFHVPYVGSAMVLEFLAGFAIARGAWWALPIMLACAWGDPRVLAYGPPAALLLWLCVKLEKQFRRKWLAPLAMVGDASYSIYLTHAIIGERFAMLPVPWLVWLSLAVGIAFHFAIEKPLVVIVRRLQTGRANSALAHEAISSTTLR